MSKEKVEKSNTPMLIIVGVLVVAVLGGWWFYSSSKSKTPSASSSGSTNANTTKPRTNAIPPNAPLGANPPNMAGSPSAVVTLEEFADFQCGSCASAHPILNEIKSIYGTRINFVFRNFPLAIPAHDKAYDAAVAAESAGLQGKFWDMQNLLFNNQQAWTAAPTYKQIWKGYAEKIGLDVPKWETDMIGIQAKGRVDADISRGKALSINSTPSLFLNGMAVSISEMKVDALKTLIDAELKKAQPVAPASTPEASNSGN